MSHDPVDVLLRRLDPELPAPAYAHPGDAGADLRTTVDAELAPGERAVLPTGDWLSIRISTLSAIGTPVVSGSTSPSGCSV